MKNEKFVLDLHLFDGEGGSGGDGGAPGAGAAAVADPVKTGKTGKSSDAASLTSAVYGVEAGQVEEIEPAVDLDAGDGAPEETFDDLIKGKYKTEYDKRVQEQIARRFKGQEQQQAALKKMESLTGLLAGRYGVDPKDMDALTAAIESDEKLYEAEALEQGIPVEYYKRMKQAERENAELKRAVEERQRAENVERIYGQWMQQAEAARQVYPQLDFMAEAQNDDFVRLLKAGVDVRAAYEVVHRDEIIGGAMQFTAKTVAEKVSNDIRARGARPQENGLSGQSSTSVRKARASELTREDVLELARRAKNGIITQF